MESPGVIYKLSSGGVTGVDVFGNALFTNFFANLKKMDELKNALKAYIQAEANNFRESPDLHYNRAGIHKYLENYAEAIKDFELASKFDPGLDSKTHITKIQQYVEKVDFLVENKVIYPLPGSLTSLFTGSREG